MSFEETSGNPLVDCESDVFNQLRYTSFIPFHSLLNSFEEELNKTFKRVLIHVIDDTKGNA